MRYMLVVSYDGAFFHGFQRQKNLVSVQETLEIALSDIFKMPIVVKGSGRTDAGVHAKGQVVHFDSEQVIPCNNLKKILNKKVYPHIYVTHIQNVTTEFHSRGSAIKKEYRYYVSIGTFDPLKVNYQHFFHDRIDISKIREAMTYIVGTHDFKSFSKNHNLATTVRTIESFELDIKEGILEFRIVGNGFMYNMVRIIIALMLKVGEGKLQPQDIQRIIEGKERKLAPYVAPAHGLYLWKVYYPEYLLEEK